MRRIGLVVALTLALAATACARQPSPPTPGTSRSEAATTTVYLAPAAGGHLSEEDLAAHPEVKVVHNPASFESAASTRTSLWVDVDSSATVDWQWVAKRGYLDLYPVALVGLDDEAGLSGKLQLMGILRDKPRPGYTVWIVVPRELTGSESAYLLRGYPDTPTVDAISALTDDALRGGYPWLPRR